MLDVRRLTGAAVGIAVAASLGLTACGGSSGSGTAAGATGTSSSPATTGSSSSPTVSVPAIKAPTVGGPKFCQDLVSAETKLSTVGLSQLEAGGTNAAATASTELGAEKATFAMLASEAPSAIKQPVGDLAGLLDREEALVATLPSAAANPAAEAQAVEKLEGYETGQLATDTEALSTWLATHCTV